MRRKEEPMKEIKEPVTCSCGERYEAVFTEKEDGGYQNTNCCPRCDRSFVEILIRAAMEEGKGSE
jgi:hypothetical protein